MSRQIPGMLPAERIKRPTQFCVGSFVMYPWQKKRDANSHERDPNTSSVYRKEMSACLFFRFVFLRIYGNVTLARTVYWLYRSDNALVTKGQNIK